MKNLIILGLLLLMPSLLMAQMTIDDCGVFKAGVEIGCVLFDSDNYGEYLFYCLADPSNPLNQTGPYEIGDRVRIQGVIDIGCLSHCMQGDGFLIDCMVSECDYICGNINDDDIINILDVVCLINYIYKDGPPPVPLESANVNYNVQRDSEINILDVVYLINFKYKGGPSLECP